MKNKLLLIALTISLAFNISACTDTQAEASMPSNRMLYSPPYTWSSTKVAGCMVIDSQTNVEYWFIPGEGKALTLLVDQEGKPLVYKGE